MRITAWVMRSRVSRGVRGCCFRWRGRGRGWGRGRGRGWGRGRGRGELPVSRCSTHPSQPTMSSHHPAALLQGVPIQTCCEGSPADRKQHTRGAHGHQLSSYRVGSWGRERNGWWRVGGWQQPQRNVGPMLGYDGCWSSHGHHEDCKPSEQHRLHCVAARGAGCLSCGMGNLPPILIFPPSAEDWLALAQSRRAPGAPRASFGFFGSCACG
jgi:hypothetical protein